MKLPNRLSELVDLCTLPPDRVKVVAFNAEGKEVADAYPESEGQLLNMLLDLSSQYHMVDIMAY